jgi:hypothetical protein
MHDMSELNQQANTALARALKMRAITSEAKASPRPPHNPAAAILSSVFPNTCTREDAPLCAPTLENLITLHFRI